MKTPDLDRLIVRAYRRMARSDTEAEALLTAIAQEADAFVLHEAAADVDRLGDRIDARVSRDRAG